MLMNDDAFQAWKCDRGVPLEEKEVALLGPQKLRLYDIIVV